MIIDSETRWLLFGVYTLLIIASIVGWILTLKLNPATHITFIQNYQARIRAWWLMVLIFTFALLIGPIASIVLFALISLLAFREFIKLSPLGAGDRQSILLVFLMIIPLQYSLIAIKWYGLFAIFVPVYAFLLIPMCIVLAGETENFLARTAKIQWGLMICVYAFSHSIALFMLDIPNYQDENPKLLLFLIIVVQLSDVLQFIFGKTLGRHKIAPTVSPNKTWEGFIGGLLVSTCIGASLWWVTPFTVWQAGLISFAIVVMGFVGGLCMSAIKRDRGIKDFGTIIEGHGGIMDRIDSLCFAAPIFFHIIRYYFSVN